MKLSRKYAVCGLTEIKIYLSTGGRNSLLSEDYLRAFQNRVMRKVMDLEGGGRGRLYKIAY